jgi:selenocysteine-specific elongation factor
VPLDSDRLVSGAAARVQLVFDAPVCAVPGDRFIVRDAQAAHTVGGGMVLDPVAPARKRRSAERTQHLDALERMIEGEGIAPLLRHARHGVPLSALARLTCHAPERVPLPADALVIEAGPERFVFLPSAWTDLREHALRTLREYHASAPDEPGPDAGRLRRIALPELPQPLWRRLIDDLVAEQAVARTGPWLHLPEHTARLSERDEALAGRLQPLIAAGRFDPPWVRDLAALVHEPEPCVRQLLRKQVTRGDVHQVVRDLFYDSGCVRELADIAARLAREHGSVDAARFRDAVGLGRKRSIQILEYFDRIGYTRRVGDTHLLRVDSGWRIGPS